MYLTSLSSNGKSWAEMTQVEKNTLFIVLGIIVIGAIGYGIYYYFKNRKKD